MHIFNVCLNIIFQNKLWHCDFTLVLIKYNIFPLSFILKHQNIIFASVMHEFEWKNFTGFPTSTSSQQQNSFQWGPASFNVIYSKIKFLGCINFLDLLFLALTGSSDISLSCVAVQCYSDMLICIIRWNEWLFQYLLPVRSSSSDSNRTFSNRKQTSDYFIYPRRAIQFSKKTLKPLPWLREIIIWWFEKGRCFFISDMICYPLQ